MENKQVTNPAAPNLTEPTGIHHEAQLEGEVQPGAETTRTLMVMLEWKGDVTHEQQLEILRERMVGCLVGGGTDFSAGPRRNRAMAQKDPRADLCLAFWSGKFTKRGGREVSGTFNMITEALAAGIPVTIHPPRAA